MEAIINDFSLCSQFESIEQFIDELADYTLPVFNRLAEFEYKILSSYETYKRRVTDQFSLQLILQNPRQFRGYPEAHALLRYLSICVDSPYWEDDPRSVEPDDGNYEHPMGELAFPNCFTEALARSCPLISFYPSPYRENLIELRKSGRVFTLFNVYDLESVSIVLFRNRRIGLSELLMSGKYDGNISERLLFFQKNSKYFADPDIDFDAIDACTVLQDFKSAMHGIYQGQRDTKYIRTIQHGSYQGKVINYAEFRTQLHNGNQFRIYFSYEGSKLVFLNSYIKKEQDTPRHIKEYSVKLIKEYRQDWQT